MKIKLNTLLLLLVLPIYCIAQKTKIYPPFGGFILKDNHENYDPLFFSKTQNNPQYLIAVKPEFITQVFSLDSILDKHLSEYKINLKQVSPLDHKKVENKLIFSGFIDKNNHINIIEYISNYQYTHVNLKAPYFTSIINEKLSQNNFKIIDENNEVFKQKKNGPDYALAGEILSYTRKTKGTPGFIVSVIVKWSLFDIANEETVYKVITGGYINNGKRNTEKESLKLALDDATNALIIDKNIIKYIYGDNKTETTTKQEVIIPKIEKDIKTDNLIENAIQSSLTIKTKFGHGSGFLISSSGYILTNFHVIEDSTDIQAIFQNGLILPVQIVSFDKKMDVALCKIPGMGYNPLPLDTNSVTKKIGSDVMAIGTPEDLKLGQTVTKGIISGLREIKSNVYIQTDVSINSGNSGGMLINKSGEVIGIICSKIKGEGIEGLGFAIPLNVTLKTLNIKISEK